MSFLYSNWQNKSMFSDIFGLLFSTNSVLILTTLFPWILYFTARGCPWRTRIYMCMLSDSKLLFSNSVPMWIFCFPIGFFSTLFQYFHNSVSLDFVLHCTAAGGGSRRRWNAQNCPIQRKLGLIVDRRDEDQSEEDFDDDRGPGDDECYLNFTTVGTIKRQRNRFNLPNSVEGVF